MIGAVLAGGEGRRMGGGKPARLLAGRPLIAYPVAALAQLCERVAVIAKPGTVLPMPVGAERWSEPAVPRHPLTGIVAGLERAGEALLVVAADMPFVTADALSALVAESGDRRPDGVRTVVAVSDGVLQPLLAVYAPSALGVLRAAEPDAPLTRTVEALRPLLVELPASLTRSVDTPEQLAAAERELAR